MEEEGAGILGAEIEGVRPPQDLTGHIEHATMVTTSSVPPGILRKHGGVEAPVGLTVFKTAGGLLSAVSGRFDSDTPLPY